MRCCLRGPPHALMGPEPCWKTSARSCAKQWLLSLKIDETLSLIRLYSSPATASTSRCVSTHGVITDLSPAPCLSPAATQAPPRPDGKEATCTHVHEELDYGCPHSPIRLSEGCTRESPGAAMPKPARELEPWPVQVWIDVNAYAYRDVFCLAADQ